MGSYTYKNTPTKSPAPIAPTNLNGTMGKLATRFICTAISVARSCCIPMMKNRFFPYILRANVAVGSKRQSTGFHLSVRNARRK